MAGSGDGDDDAAGANVLVIKGQPRQTLGSSDILRQLFEQRALPHTTTRWTVLRSDRRSGILFLLQDSGIVDSIDSLVTPGVAASWQLTVSGLHSVLMCGRLGQFSPLCDVRLGIPLQDRTAYELQLLLRDGGWTWYLLPRPRTVARRQVAQAYSVGGPLRWFTRPSGQSFAVAREYLLCLLNAEVLQRDHGIDEIPHGLPQDTYALLLQGIPLAQHAPAPARCRERLRLEPDCDGDNDDEAAPRAVEPEEDATEEEQEEQLCIYVHIYIYMVINIAIIIYRYTFVGLALVTRTVTTIRPWRSTWRRYVVLCYI